MLYSLEITFTPTPLEKLQYRAAGISGDDGNGGNDDENPD
jgi:hypothetical protein